MAKKSLTRARASAARARGRHLDHRAERRQRIGNAPCARCRRPAARASRSRAAVTSERSHHRQQDLHRPVDAGAQDGAELGLEEVGAGERQPDAPQIPSGEAALSPSRLIESLRDLLAAEVERADGHRPAVGPSTMSIRAADCSSSWGCVGAVHEQELGPQTGRCPRRRTARTCVHFDRQFDVGVQADAGAVAGDGRPLASRRSCLRSAFRCSIAAADRYAASAADGLTTIWPRSPSMSDLRRRSRLHRAGAGAQHGGKAEGAGHDRGVALRAADRGGEPGDTSGSSCAASAGVSSSATKMLPLAGAAIALAGRFFGQEADQAIADLADVVDTRRDVGIVALLEALGDDGRPRCGPRPRR